jgi:hypothetical protein
MGQENADLAVGEMIKNHASATFDHSAPQCSPGAEFDRQRRCIGSSQSVRAA